MSVAISLLKAILHFYTLMKIKGHDPGGTVSYTPAHSIRNFNVPTGSHPLR